MRRPFSLLLALLLAEMFVAPSTGAQQRTRVAQELLDRAAARGSVPVIVQLASDAGPEGRMATARARRQQRDRIRDAQSGLLQDLAGTSHRAVRRFRSVPALALEVGPEALRALERSPRVAAVQEDRLHRPTLDVSVARVEADQSQALGLDGSRQAVVVLDTGVDALHPNLAGRILSEACFAAGSPYGSGACPNGSAYDDGPGSGSYCTWASDCFHGTHVAGIATGTGSTLRGVAAGAGLIAIQVFSRFSGSSCGASGGPCSLSYTSDQIAALEHVYDTLRHQHAIAAVNLSLGGGAHTSTTSCDQANSVMKAAIDNLRSVGIATVVAAGNSGYVNAISEPGCISSAVSVGAVDDADNVAGFSNGASFLSLWAPGVRIRAPYYGGGGFADASGTSMAAPHVAGAWAILKQRAPEASVEQILDALRATGEPIADAEAQTSRIRIAHALSAFVECADGIDNDGDGRVDLDDPGCLNQYWPTESSSCDDGVDDDGDGGVDWDGIDLDGDGRFDGPGEAAPDAQCRGMGWSRETGIRCGLGFEVALLLPGLLWLRGSRRRHLRAFA